MATTYRLTRLAREYAGLHEVIEAAQAGRRPFRVWRQDDDVDDGEGHSDEEADDPDGDGEDRVVLRGPREHVLRLDGRPDPETGTHVVSVDMFEIVTTPARLLASPLVTPESRAQLCQRKSFFIGSAGVRLMTAHQNVSVRCCRVRLGACLSSFFFGETQLVAEIQSTENACFDQQMTRLRKHYRPRQRGLPKGL